MQQEKIIQADSRKKIAPYLLKILNKIPNNIKDYHEIKNKMINTIEFIDNFNNSYTILSLNTLTKIDNDLDNLLKNKFIKNIEVITAFLVFYKAQVRLLKYNYEENLERRLNHIRFAKQCLKYCYKHHFDSNNHPKFIRIKHTINSYCQYVNIKMLKTPHDTLINYNSMGYSTSLKEMTPLSRLPLELKYKILFFLDIKQLFIIATVNKHFHTIIKDIWLLLENKNLSKIPYLLSIQEIVESKNKQSLQLMLPQNTQRRISKHFLDQIEPYKYQSIFESNKYDNVFLIYFVFWLLFGLGSGAYLSIESGYWNSDRDMTLKIIVFFFIEALTSILSTIAGGILLLPCVFLETIFSTIHETAEKNRRKVGKIKYINKKEEEETDKIDIEKQLLNFH